MGGEPIQLVEDGMATIIKAIKQDPYAIETVWLSIIVFAGQAKTLVPLQEIVSFYPPKFPIGGGTSLSKGLGHLMHELENNVVKTTFEKKGDWKPIIFLFTDGNPTDDSRDAITEWKQKWSGTANLVAIAFGNEPNTKALLELTENVLHFNNSFAQDYSKFFKWVTDSIKTSSCSVKKNESGFELANLDEIVLSKVSASNLNQSHIPNSNFVVLSAQCQNMKRSYLIKYRKVGEPSIIPGIDTRRYRLVGGFQIDDKSYDELSDQNIPQTINSEELIGAPACPCCGNQFGFAVCTCNGIHCIGDEDFSTCPWCNTTSSYGAGDGGFDVSRTLG